MADATSLTMSVVFFCVHVFVYCILICACNPKKLTLDLVSDFG